MSAATPLHRSRHTIRASSILVTAFAFAVAACSTPTAPLPGTGAPGEFEFSIWGFPVGSTNVGLRGDTLLVWRVSFVHRPGEAIDTARTVPTDEAWRAFWAATERAGVHHWRPQYMAEGVVDGGAWSTRIVTGGRTVQSSGSNAYPDRRGREHELNVTADFQVFLTAVSDLAGQRVGY